MTKVAVYNASIVAGLVLVGAGVGLWFGVPQSLTICVHWLSACRFLIGVSADVLDTQRASACAAR